MTVDGKMITADPEEMLAEALRLRNAENRTLQVYYIIYIIYY
jgi:hypothetical protein